MTARPAEESSRRRRRTYGDGSVYKRQEDGYWVGAFYARTTTGARRRVVVYGKTLNEVRTKLSKAQRENQAGTPVPDEVWRLDRYLQYWLENFIKINRRPATYSLYELTVRLHLIPRLGRKSLTRLSVADVQTFLNQRLAAGDSLRTVHLMREVLSAALARAVREELVTRNVARLAELPGLQRGSIRPWSADEARQFLTVCKPEPLYAGFVLLVLYGLRRGEVLGLRWSDIDFDTGRIRIRQQLQRVGRQLLLGPVKTRAGNRGLPLLDLARRTLDDQLARQSSYRTAMGSAWPETDLVFTTRTGRPVEPRNFVRSFRRICDDNDIRLIRVHHVRHTVASLLKDLKVPARDAQAILGHTRITTTLEIYTDTDDAAKLDALTRLHDLFDGPSR